MARSPAVGRSAQGFSTDRAQKWILAAALITGIVYAFRAVIEPSVSSSPAKGSSLLGGSPPPPVGKWAVAYGAGFLMLSILALGAPEVAGSFAMLEIAGVLLTNGTSVIADLSGLEGKPAAAGVSTIPASASTPNVAPNSVIGSTVATQPLPTNLSTGNNPRGTAIT